MQTNVAHPLRPTGPGLSAGEPQDRYPEPATQQAPHLRVVPSTTSGPPPQKCHVVVIDDHECDYMIAQRFLNRAEGKFEVSWARSYEEGLAAIARDAASVYLVDYRLGARSGIELIEVARARGSKAPLVLLTGMGDEVVDAAATRAGATDYLDKDAINGETLSRVVRRAIERERVTSRIREEWQRYREAVKGSAAAIWRWDLREDRFYFSPYWKQMLGFGVDEFQDSKDAWLERIHEGDRDSVWAGMLAHVRQPTNRLSLDYRVLHRDGTYRWMHMRGLARCGDGGAVTEITGTQTDVTERKERECEALRRALRDPLTNLPNRELLVDRIDAALARVRRERGYAFAVVYMDLDGFKPINDTYGHSAGDDVLRTVATRLQTTLREVDTVARVGGDEFVVLLDGCSDEQSVKVAVDKLMAAVSEPIELRHASVSVGCSVGPTLVRDDTRSSAAILEDADRRMYGDKRRSRSTAERSQTVEIGAIRRWLVEDSLQHASITPRLEPIVEIEGRRRVAFDIRQTWVHPQHGVLDVAKLIPASSPCGAWSQLLNRTVIAARDRAADLPDAGLSLSIGVSAHCLSDRVLLHETMRALAPATRASLPFSVYLTEVDQVDSPAVIAGIEALRARGLGVELDIGTNLESFPSLVELPVDAIRVSSGVTLGLASDDLLADILGPLVRVGERMQARIIVTDVCGETEIEALHRHGIRFVQGSDVAIAKAEPTRQRASLSVV